MKSTSIICFLCSVHIISAKPFLENLLFQVATSLSSSTPDDPQSHVSDFRSQPKANSRFDRYEAEPIDEGKHNTTIEKEDASTSIGILGNSKGFRLFPWLRSNNGTEKYSDIIGNIIGLARERITVAFQRLLSPLQRHRQESHQQEQYHHSYSESNETDAASTNLMNSPIKNQMSRNSSNITTNANEESTLFSSSSEIQPEKIDHELVIKEAVISSNATHLTKNKNNALVETTSDFGGLALPIEESNPPKVSFQLDNDYAFETNESVIGPIQSEKGFLAKRLEHISKRLNETRNQFRARTIQAVSSLVPLVQLVTERRGRKLVNSLETKTISGSLENYGTAKNNEENNFPLPPRLSRLSSNLLALHPRSKERRTALVFQNAFNKYAQLVINGGNASTDDRTSISNTIEQKEGNDNYSTNDEGGSNMVGADDDNGNDDDDDDDDDDDNDDEYENKDAIASSIGNGAGEEVIDNNVSSRASYISATTRMNMQSVATVGILILEVFGSIAGLTWGAFNQLQLLFP